MNTTNSTRPRQPYTFSFTVGDRSDDGHGETRTVFLRLMCLGTTDGTREAEIAAAYNAAKDKAPKLEPSTYCKDYDDNEVPEDVRVLWEAYGQNPKGELYVDDYATLCAAFLNIGDPALEAGVVGDPTPSLDNIFGFCGYGLFRQ